MCEINDELYILPELQETSEATLNSSVDLSAKSKSRYELTYQSFQKWQESSNMNSVDEHVLLAYFQEQSTIKTPATLWSLYSMLKSMISLQLNVNIGNYNELLAFLKDKSKGYTSAKPKKFTDEEITKFIEEAPDITYLATKVVLIFCMSGACRTDELVNLCIDDIKMHGPMYRVKIPESETSPARSFAIWDQYFDIVRKYHLLRPRNAQSNRFFLNYQKGKCTIQVIGKNKFCRMAHEIAQFLKLEDADRYTGYSYRRTTTILTKDSLKGASITGISSSIKLCSTLGAGTFKTDFLNENEVISRIPPLDEAYSTNSDDSTASESDMSDEYCALPETKDQAKASVNLAPTNSKEKYKNVYEAFKTWRKTRKAPISEDVLLMYFEELKNTNKPNSLWAIFSMLKSTVKMNDQTDIGTYSKLITFLKQNSENYVPKKSRILSHEDIEKFLNEAPDYTYLAMKVALIFGIMGGLRVDELVNIVENDVTEHNGIFLVRISKTSRKPKSFTIHDEYFDIVKRYMSVRCQKSACSNRFFLTYRNGKCIVQPIGKNTLSTMPKKIAEYLKLEDPQSYTGHSFRRSSATLFASTGGDLSTLQRQVSWQSSKIAESYTEDSIASKTKIPILTASVTEDTKFPGDVAKEMGLSNSEPIFCDVNTVKIEAPDSPSQANELVNEPFYSNVVFCDTNAKSDPSEVPEPAMEPPSSDLFFCEADAMDEELNSPISTSELVFCDENDLVDATYKEEFLEMKPQLENFEQLHQSPNSLEEITNKTREQLLPMQSKEKYNSVYQKFRTWRKTKNVPISENVMLRYFNELMETMQPSSLWAMYSMLKTTIKIYDQRDIGAYSNLIALLKRNSENYTPKKSSILSDENIEKFLDEAPDDQFLAIKVALIFGIMGGLRIEELVSILQNDVTEHDGIFLVRIPKTNTKKSKSFTIHGEYFNIVKKYTSLRPQKSTCSNRFFLNYRYKTCTVQPIGKNKLATMPRKIAEYLDLENPKLYTGHSFRRSSTTLLGNAIGDLVTLRRCGGLQSSKIANSLADESTASKTKTASPISTILPSTSPTKINSDVRPSALPSQSADSGVPASSETVWKNREFPEKKAVPRRRKKKKVASGKSACDESGSSEENEMSPSEESSSGSESKAPGRTEGTVSPLQVLETTMDASNSDLFFCETDGMDEKLHSPISTSELVFGDGIGLADELTSKEQVLDTTRLSDCGQVSRSPNGKIEHSSLDEMANKTSEQLLPPQSKEKYYSVYQKFQTWRKTKNDPISEDVMLSYFAELVGSIKPSSLWAIFSMLKTTIKIYDQCDIGVYSNLIAFLKRNSENYTPKKSSVLSDENIARFLNDAPDDQFLAMKVALIFGIMGGLRIDELVKIVTDDVTEHNGIFLVRIPNTSGKKPKSFTIHDEYFNIVKRYTSLRPHKSGCSNRFFLTYRNRCCIVQPIGKNTLATMPRKIAEYLGLENPELYTGHSFRRSSTTRRGNAIGDSFTLKRYESWPSMKVAGSHPDKSVASGIVASTINLPPTVTKISSNLPASPIHSNNEPKARSKRSFPKEQPPSSHSGVSKKKIRASPSTSNSFSVDKHLGETRVPRRSFAYRRRYVGDWKRSDMNSSILARRFFDFAANCINKKNGALQSLRSENQRLVSRVEFLENLLDQKQFEFR